MVMPVEPSWLDDVIWLMPAMRPNWRSSGVATADAMVSGLAPGSDAPTEITGKSICGSGDTGSCVYASPPASSRANVSSVVATGRSIAGAETFMHSPTSDSGQTSSPRLGRRGAFKRWRSATAKPVKPEINHRRGVQASATG